jgi:mannose-6-phosphate isomerase-like protein (cupin superfamily)
MSKNKIIEKVTALLGSKGIAVASQDMNRPWGGFFVIDDAFAARFIDVFFGELKDELAKYKGKLSPKILCVAPKQRLSWQYHHRRAELWKLIEGRAKIVRSMTDIQGKTDLMKKGALVTLAQGERHRLVGSNHWGIVAEIWQHTDPKRPSDEEDIVRLEDDFGR